MTNEKHRIWRIRGAPLPVGQEFINPAELWLDESIEPEMLIELDPLDINDDMVEQAEEPELADPLLTDLRARRSTNWSEDAWLRRRRARARK